MAHGCNVLPVKKYLTFKCVTGYLFSICLGVYGDFSYF